MIYSRTAFDEVLRAREAVRDGRSSAMPVVASGAGKRGVIAAVLASSYMLAEASREKLGKINRKLHVSETVQKGKTKVSRGVSAAGEKLHLNGKLSKLRDTSSAKGKQFTSAVGEKSKAAGAKIKAQPTMGRAIGAVSGAFSSVSSKVDNKAAKIRAETIQAIAEKRSRKLRKQQLMAPETSPSSSGFPMPPAAESGLLGDGGATATASAQAGGSPTPGFDYVPPAVPLSPSVVASEDAGVDETAA